MAKKMLESFGNSKTRMLALFAIVLLLVIVVVVYFSVRKPNPLKTEESRTSKIPQITSIPGNVTSEKISRITRRR